MNHLLADDSHEISSLGYYKQELHYLKMSYAANFVWHFKGQNRKANIFNGPHFPLLAQ